MKVRDKKRLGAKGLAEILRREVRGKGMTPGTPVMSSRKLADHYEVSLLTANRALNHLVDEKLLYRVQGSGTYVNGPTGKRLWNVGIVDVMPSPDSPGDFASDGVWSVACFETLRKSCARLRHVSYPEIKSWVSTPYALDEFDGLIVASTHVDNFTIPLLQKFKGALVIYRCEDILDIPCNQVLPEMHPAFAEAAELIVKQREIKNVMIVSTEGAHAERRVALFISALRHAGFDPMQLSLEKLGLTISDKGQMAGGRFVRSLLKRNEELPDLIYTTSDFIAIGMVEAFEEAHIKVGSEIRILGFDNIEGYGLVSERGEFLSSIDLPRRRIGVEAAKLLLKNLEYPKDCWDAIKVPSSLVLRKSWHPIENKSKERIER